MAAFVPDGGGAPALRRNFHLRGSLCCSTKSHCTLPTPPSRDDCAIRRVIEGKFRRQEATEQGADPSAKQHLTIRGRMPASEVPMCTIYRQQHRICPSRATHGFDIWHKTHTHAFLSSWGRAPTCHCPKGAQCELLAETDPRAQRNHPLQQVVANDRSHWRPYDA